MRQEPIQYFESTKQQYQLCVRTFAPWARFSGFEGDNRDFSTSPNDTFRTGGFLVFDLSNQQIAIAPIGQSSGTRMDKDDAKVFANVSANVSKLSSVNNKLSLTFSTAGSNPKIPASPDIDVVLSLTIYIKNESLYLKGNAKGDGFPNVEIFLRDSGNNPYVLAEFSTEHGPTLGPIALVGRATKEIAKFEVGILLDQNGNFIGSTAFED